MFRDEKSVIYKSPCFEKLVRYGFVKEGERYLLSTDIKGGDFRLDVAIGRDGVPELCIIDSFSDEEYTLAFNPNAVGEFVGSVRADCEKVLADIIESCFETDIFKSSQTRRVLRYAEEVIGTKPDFPFDDSHDAAVLREQKSRKWYGIVMHVKRSSLGIDGDGILEVMNLKAKPEDIQSIVDGKSLRTAYHMNKTHWFTIILDGSVDDEKIFSLMRDSHNLICKKKKTV